MRSSVPLIVALICIPVLSVLAEGTREEALAKIEALLEAGELEPAKRAIDHLLEHHPDDPDLRRLSNEWRLRRSGVRVLLTGEGDLRARCWRIVEATLRGNPEEWPALLAAGDEARVRKILSRLAGTGSPEDRRTATRLAARRDEPPPPASTRTAAELREAARKGPEECLAALREAERRKLDEAAPLARTVLAGARSATLRSAAAAVLLALGDETPRPALRKALRSERPVDAVAAAEVLFRHPGAGSSPVRRLFLEIEGDERILRVKPTLLALAIEAMGRRKEPGAQEFLEARLGSAAHRMDAARALGALGDRTALPRLLEYLRSEPPEEERTADSGLGYLGRASATAAAAEAEELRPILVGALAVLRVTAQKR